METLLSLWSLLCTKIKFKRSRQWRGWPARFVAVVTGLAFLVGAISSQAGWNFNTRNTCKWYAKKYAANADCGCSALLLSYQHSSGCDTVTAHAGPKTCLYGAAEAYAQNGPGGAHGWAPVRWGLGWVG